MADPQLLLAPPLWAYGVLSLAVVACSSGGVWFALQAVTPPILKACWRLTLTALLQAVGLAVQLRRVDAATLATWHAEAPLLTFSGICLGVHFSSWSWSVDHTTLTHSLLFVSASPLLIVSWMAMRYSAARVWTQPPPPPPPPVADGEVVEAGSGAAAPVLSVPADVVGTEPVPAAPPVSSLPAWVRSCVDPATALPPTRLEAAGTVLGFLGAAVLIVTAAERPEGRGSGVEPSASVAGDAVALLGALTVWGYLEVGSLLRKGKGMPIFLYSAPVSAVAALTAGAASALLEPTFLLTGTSPSSLLGWLGEPRAFGLTLGAALGSGILGHTAANLSLKYLNPLLVSVAWLSEPLIGSFFGLLAGVAAVPGLTTLLAGPLLLAGALLVTLGARDSGFDADKWRARLCCGRGGLPAQLLD
jgi:drug/metabolite transporter (DMT)-like permease